MQLGEMLRNFFLGRKTSVKFHYATFSLRNGLLGQIEIKNYYCGIKEYYTGIKIIIKTTNLLYENKILEKNVLPASSLIIISSFEAIHLHSLLY